MEMGGWVVVWMGRDGWMKRKMNGWVDGGMDE